MACTLSAGVRFAGRTSPTDRGARPMATGERPFFMDFSRQAKDAMRPAARSFPTGSRGRQAP